MLTDEQRELVVANMRFAYWFARNRAMIADKEEACNICLHSLAEAAATWDPSRGVNFRSYSSVFMVRALSAEHHNSARCPTRELGDVAGADVDAATEKLIAWLKTAGAAVAAASELHLAILASCIDRTDLKAVARKFGRSLCYVRSQRDQLFAKLRRQALVDELF